MGGADVASCEADAPDVPSWTHVDAIQCGAFATICIVENSLVIFVFFSLPLRHLILVVKWGALDGAIIHSVIMVVMFGSWLFGCVTAGYGR